MRHAAWLGLALGLLALAACRSNSRERPAAAPAWLLERARQEGELAARSSVTPSLASRNAATTRNRWKLRVR